MRGPEFIRVGDTVVPREDIRSIDLRQVDKLQVTVHLTQGPSLKAHGADTVDLLMRLCPSAFEGPRLRFVKHSWVVHNFVGHPLMQLCAWLGRPKLGLWIHDVTVPTPRG